MHVVKNLGLREVAGIYSCVYLPPIIVVSGGFLRAPIRVFAVVKLLCFSQRFIRVVDAFSTVESPRDAGVL